jgi:hypothetical protein
MKTLEIILVAAATLLGIFLKMKWGNLSGWERVGVIVASLVALTIAYNGYKKNKDEDLIKRVEAKVGEIEDPHGAKLPSIEIGQNSGTIISLTNSNVFFATNEGPLFKVMVEANKLFVYVVIRQAKDDVLAVIEKNVWTVFDNDFEYNNDDEGFELVTKGDRKVFFQIFLNKGYASLSGILMDKKGVGIALYPSIDQEGGMYSNLTVPGCVEAVYKSTPRLFKYPRSKFLGIRDKK